MYAIIANCIERMKLFFLAEKEKQKNAANDTTLFKRCDKAGCVAKLQRKAKVLKKQGFIKEI